MFKLKKKRVLMCKEIIIISILYKVTRRIEKKQRKIAV